MYLYGFSGYGVFVGHDLAAHFVRPCLGELRTGIYNDGGVVNPGDEHRHEGGSSVDGSYARHPDVEGYRPLFHQQKQGGDDGPDEDIFRLDPGVGQHLEYQAEDSRRHPDVEEKAYSFDQVGGYIRVVCHKPLAQVLDDIGDREGDEQDEGEYQDDGERQQPVLDILQPAFPGHGLDVPDGVQRALHLRKNGGRTKDGDSQACEGGKGERVALGSIFDDCPERLDHVGAENRFQLRIQRMGQIGVQKDADRN